MFNMNVVHGIHFLMSVIMTNDVLVLAMLTVYMLCCSIFSIGCIYACSLVGPARVQQSGGAARQAAHGRQGGLGGLWLRLD